MSEDNVTEEDMREMCEMRKRPSTWPVRPFLPLYNRRTGDLALIVEGHGNTLFECLYPDALMVLWSTDGVKSPMFRAWLRQQSSVRFKSFNEVLDDGWLID